MGKPEVVRLTQWPENNKTSSNKSSDLTKMTELFRGLLKIYGTLLPNVRKYSQQKSDKFSIKASFTEIYNEQIKDLLNPTSGVLHCRWNPANGFFV
jgi:hypothetical protein